MVLESQTTRDMQDYQDNKPSTYCPKELENSLPQAVISRQKIHRELVLLYAETRLKVEEAEEQMEILVENRASLQRQASRALGGLNKALAAAEESRGDK